MLERNGLTPTISTCSSRTRRTGASSSPRPRSSASTASKVDHQHRAVRQHDGRDDSAGAERRRLLGPAEEGRSRAARLGRRRIHRRAPCCCAGASEGCMLVASSCCRPPTAAAGARQQVLSPQAAFAARRGSCARAQGAPLGDVFTFVSGLYFRGKLAYARRFASPPEPRIRRRLGRARHHAERRAPQPETPVTRRRAARLRRRRRRSRPTRATGGRSSGARARWLREIGADCEVVLLGSIASPKYVDVLLDDLRRAPAVPDRFRRPRRHEPRRPAAAQARARASSSTYAPMAGAVRHGARPPKLPPLDC